MHTEQIVDTVSDLMVQEAKVFQIYGETDLDVRMSLADEQ